MYIEVLHQTKLKFYDFFAEKSFCCVIKKKFVVEHQGHRSKSFIFA